MALAWDACGGADTGCLVLFVIQKAYMAICASFLITFVCSYWALAGPRHLALRLTFSLSGLLGSTSTWRPSARPGHARGDKEDGGARPRAKAEGKSIHAGDPRRTDTPTVRVRATPLPLARHEGVVRRANAPTTPVTRSKASSLKHLPLWLRFAPSSTMQRPQSRNKGKFSSGTLFYANVVEQQIARHLASTQAVSGAHKF